MKHTTMAVAAGAATVFAIASVATPGAANAAAGSSCDRTCLNGMVDHYLDALTAHDPSRLPMAKSVRYTENTNTVKVGDGLWQTADGIDASKLYLADPANGEAMFYGGVRENGTLALLAVRLKVQNRRVTEIETSVIRKASGIHGNFEKLREPEALWSEPLPASERRSRAAMIHASNQYFNGIEQSSGDIVPFKNGECMRFENNAQTAGPRPATPPPTGNTAPPPAAGTAGALNLGPMTCRQQFNTGLNHYITHVTQRRVVAVDEERGVVVWSVMFQHPGNIRSIDVPGHGKVEVRGALASYPNTTNIIEAFKVEGGELNHIHAYVNLLPYRQSPGWPVK
jgi:hypothetical protein